MTDGGRGRVLAAWQSEAGAWLRGGGGLGWAELPRTRAFEGITPAPRPGTEGGEWRGCGVGAGGGAAARNRWCPAPASAAARPPHSAGDSAAALPPAAPGRGCSPVTEFPKMYPLEYLA